MEIYVKGENLQLYHHQPHPHPHFNRHNLPLLQFFFRTQLGTFSPKWNEDFFRSKISILQELPFIFGWLCCKLFYINSQTKGKVCKKDFTFFYFIYYNLTTNSSSRQLKYKNEIILQIRFILQIRDPNLRHVEWGIDFVHPLTAVGVPTIENKSCCATTLFLRVPQIQIFDLHLGPTTKKIRWPSRIILYSIVEEGGFEPIANSQMIIWF